MLDEEMKSPLEILRKAGEQRPRFVTAVSVIADAQEIIAETISRIRGVEVGTNGRDDRRQRLMSPPKSPALSHSLDLR